MTPYYAADTRAELERFRKLRAIERDARVANVLCTAIAMGWSAMNCVGLAIVLFHELSVNYAVLAGAVVCPIGFLLSFIVLSLTSSAIIYAVTNVRRRWAGSP